MKPARSTRFSLSMQEPLVRRLDAMARERGFPNRSRAVEAMVRDRLVEHAAARGKGEIAGTVTLVYDHHRPGLQARLTAVQHDHHHAIISTLHVHLDHDHCIEVLVVRGPAPEVRALADRLCAVKGVQHGKLTVTATGREFR
jgi:CopG family nickel-responsive transcriptional regulator